MTWNLTDQSLCQLRGISRDAERKYHRADVTSAEMLLRTLAMKGPESLHKRVSAQAQLFRRTRQLGLTDVIVNQFPVGARTRVVSDRYEKTLFFDVETDGNGSHAGVTLIGAIINGTEHVFVRGVDLMDFLEVWRTAEILVSFNGKRFDVPVLMRTFGISTIPAHVDLMDEARHYGLKGGLKEIEKRIGFVRETVDCRDGLCAIDLWRRYNIEGDDDALKALKAYNLEDVRSLVALYRYLLPLAKEELVDL